MIHTKIAVVASRQGLWSTFGYAMRRNISNPSNLHISRASCIMCVKSAEGSTEPVTRTTSGNSDVCGAQQDIDAIGIDG